MAKKKQPVVAQPAVPAPYVPRRAFDTLVASKPRSSGGGFAATTLSTGIHIALIGGLIWATMRIGTEVAEDTEPQIVEMTTEIEIPPPPPPEPPPVNAPPPSAEVFAGYQTLQIPPIIPPDLPPPSSIEIKASDFTGQGVAGGRAGGRQAPPGVESVAISKSADPNSAPSFTPMTVKPDLINRDEVGRVLEREYPAVLRDSNIGGTVVMWVYVNTEGKVDKTQVNTSSGQPLLDNAADRVAKTMRFSPAYNYDQKVAVWVQIPVTFRVGR
jgi:periplasmic protein TonB